jgi:hypothetical protein
VRKDWAPGWPLVGIYGALTIGFVAGALFSGQPTGRVLLTVAALAALSLTAHTALVRPRLTANADGLTVNGLGGRRVFRWSEVNVRLGHTRRLGRVNTALELDGHDVNGVEQLVILGRLDLGDDPHTVEAELRALREQHG